MKNPADIFEEDDLEEYQLQLNNLGEAITYLQSIAADLELPRFELSQLVIAHHNLRDCMDP